MSSPATATFLTWWRNNASRVPMALAIIELVTPSAATLRVSTREVTTPDGNTWEAGLRCDSIRSRMGQLDTGPNPGDCTVYLANRLYPFMSSGVVVDTLADYQWQGATCTLYLWNDVRDSAGAQRLAWADALQVFQGRIDSLQGGDSELKLTLIQDQSWNSAVPTTVVDKIAYPNAPDTSQGKPIPIIYGDHAGFGLRSPHAAAYTNKAYQEDSGAGQGAVPMVLVDPGLGAANVKLVAAAHACMDIFSRSKSVGVTSTTGYTQFLSANDVLAPIDVDGITETLGASESYITIDDDKLVAYFGVRPVDVRAGGVNTADNPRRAADPFDETSYASIDQAAGKGVLELSLPSAAALGTIEAVDVICCFSGAGGNGNTFRVRPQVPGGASGTAVTSTLGQAQSATPVILTGSWDAAFWNQSWQFGGAVTGVPWDVKCEFTGGAANTARVYWVALRVKFRPQRSLVTPGSTRAEPSSNGGLRKWFRMITKQDPWATQVPVLPDQFRFDGQFFANVKGYADDGSGTYTGSAGALIARPCDIVHHFLRTYGGLGSGSIETGAATFGSFVVARDALRNAASTDYKLACWIGQKSSVQQVIKDICSQSLMAVYLDRFTSRWTAHVWRREPAIDYDLAFERTDLPDLFDAGTMSDVGLAQGIRVRWAMDYFKGRTLFETFVNADGSSQGYTLPTVRDQVLTVVAGVNDDLDWTKGASTYADVLTAATYATPIALAVEIQTQMRTHNTEMHVGHGFTIKTGYNDKLDFKVGATTYAATMDEGEYSADGLAYEAARAMSAISGSTFSGTFSGSSFTLAISTGTFEILVHLGANVLVSGWPALGINQAAAAAASQVSQTARYRDCFWVTCERYGGATTFTLPWLTGASSATNCAELLGETRLADGTVAVGAWIATLARSTRETLCATSETAFGPRADTEVMAGWVRDEATARRLRDGIFDFGSTPPVWLKFRSHACPDMQAMRIFACSADMDARRSYPGYGTDGSWANKRMRALEVEQDMGPSFHTEVFALEA